METTIGTVLVSVLMSGCIFLLWLYLGERRKVKRKKITIKNLTSENVKLIEQVLTVKAELKTFKPDEDSK